ncbi:MULTISPECIES: methyltransferase domain-containing protein [unclassified Streptomyces]|uniref:class I SAM-dependent methyltransferase n=1 Tax=unclassified Streptomyces TaxID=2593676 RepID=UPI0036EF7D55
MANVETAEEMHRLFNRTAQAYDQSGVAFFVPIARRLVEFADISRAASVLDVGCGRGAALLAAAEAVGEDGEVLGIDLSEEMAKYAAEAARERGLSHVTVSVMNGQEPDFPPGRFDAVIGSLSVFIWTRGAADLAPYARLLRPGGVLALSAPSFFPTDDGRWGLLPESIYDLLIPFMTPAKKAAGPAYPFADFADNWLVTPGSIEKVLTEAGYRDAVVHEEEFRLVVESGAQWVEWTRTTGMRRLWDRIEQTEGPGLADEVARRVDALKGEDGTITTPVPITYIRARAPQT